jgi:hypothetical protein
MARISEDDLDRAQEKARKGGKLPLTPGRERPLSEVRHWCSNAAGLPIEVRIETVIRNGRESADAMMIVLSNGTKMRCPHQSALTQPRTLQAFLASESDGIAQPLYLAPAEAGDFYVQLCRLASVRSERPDAAAELLERFEQFITECELMSGGLVERVSRYKTIEALRHRAKFDSASVRAGRHNGSFKPAPVLLSDTESPARYVRAFEWVVYLRNVVGWTVNESALVGRMAEIGSERPHLQAWNADRSHHVHVLLYTLPEAL